MDGGSRHGLDDAIESLPSRPDAGSDRDSAFRPLSEGTRVGHYEIVELLGLGGMGAVYRARDTSLGRLVALKSPFCAAPDRALAARRFMREARAAARLTHPNIVSVYEVLEHDDQLWLAMELVRGRDLRHVLANRDDLTAGKILRWAGQLAGALSRAHAAGVLHRDIKPANIMITEDGTAMLTDFGLARSLPPVTGVSGAIQSATITAAGLRVGTPAYMSPEQLAGRPLDERSDLFSLGAVLYEMCTGHRLVPPGDDADAVAVLNSLSAGSIQSGKFEVPVGLQRIVLKAVAADPGDRFPSAESLKAELDRARQAWEAEAFLSGQWRSKRWLVAGAYLAAALSLGGLVLAYALREPPSPPSPSMAATALITWPSNEYDARLSPDEKFVTFISDRDGNRRLWLRALNGSLEQALTPAETIIFDHAWSTDGDEIAILAWDGAPLLQVLPALGGLPRFSLPLDGRFEGFRLVGWVDDAFYFETELHALLQVDVGGNVTELLAAPESVFRSGFDIRPDGNRLLYYEGSADRFAIWESNLDGTAARRLTSGKHADSDPRWGDRLGQSVLFRSNRSGQVDLWKMRLPQGTPERLTMSVAAERLSDVSGDGSVVVFVQSTPDLHLWQLDRRDNSLVQLTADALNDYSPTVSAQGNQVVFQRAKPYLDTAGLATGSELLLAEVGSAISEPRTLIDDGYVPLLSPDGRWLAFARGREAWMLDIARRNPMQVSGSLHDPLSSMFPLGWVGSHFAWAGDTLYFAESLARSKQIRWARVASGGPQTGDVVEGLPGDESLTDLSVSPDGRTLVYIRQRQGGRHRVVARSLSAGDDRLMLDGEGRALIGGWSNTGDLVLFVSVGGRLLSDFDVIAIDPLGSERNLGAVRRAVTSTLALDPRTRTVYATTVTRGIHNVVAYSLDTREQTMLTNNHLPGTSYSRMNTLGDGRSVFTTHQQSSDVWLLRTEPRSVEGS